MNKEQTIEKFCEIGILVGRDVFAHRYASDCFCSPSPSLSWGFEYNEIVTAFIEGAVREKIARLSPEELRELRGDDYSYGEGDNL